MNIVEMRHVKKYFKDGSQIVKALDGIDLSIEKGKFTVIVGTSGAGKTTLLNTIAGLYEPDEGTVILDGLNLSKMGEEQLTVFRRRKIGFVFQGYNLIPELTIKENIVFPLDLDDARIDVAYFSNLVHLLGLDNYLDAYPHMLSGGAQQCTAIARALITKPSIVLADEPTGSFDMKTTQNVAGLLKMIVATFHQTLVVITHNLDLAQLADRVVRLQDGKIV
ncbi:ABC transporter ATP-binding protein [bacterium 1XD8-76]|nr:ABC transporter ATP-binding protein [bacterium 1XD8-76]